MAYGMTSEGFIPKRPAEIQSDVNADFALIVDPDTGEYPFQNATDDTILQQIVGVFSEALGECWNAAYEGSVQFDPLKNSGAGQSATVQLNAILRKPGEAAIIQLECSGQPNTLIPAGSVVATSDRRYTYSTLTNVVIQSNGTVLVEAQATQFNNYVPPLNTVVIIQTPAPSGGWNGVTNTALISEGSYEETDEELRMRQQRSTSLTSYRIIDAIYAAVFNVPGVIFARAYQNTSFFPVDSRGIPFKEVAVVAEGGSSEEIAEAIWLRLPTGQIGYGSTSVVFYDAQGTTTPISFSRPVEVPIYVSMVIRVINRSEFSDNSAELIKERIVQYAQYGGAGNEDGFPPGTDITLSRLYTPINDIPGHSVDSLLIGTSPGSLQASDVIIPWDHVGRFSVDRIEVTVT